MLRTGLGSESHSHEHGCSTVAKTPKVSAWCSARVLGRSLRSPTPVLRHVDHHAPGERTDDVQNDVRADLQSTTGPVVIRETVTGNVDPQVRAEPQRVEFDAV